MIVDSTQTFVSALGISADKLTAQLLRRECGSRSYERGRAYFEQGRTTMLKATATDYTVQLQTLTRGSGQRTYEQSIRIDDTPFGLDIDGTCTCPVSFNCKHVVAGCLTWKAQASMKHGQTETFEQWLDRLQQPTVSAQGQTSETLLYRLALTSYGHKEKVSLYFTIARRKRDGTWGQGRRVSLSTLVNHFTSPRYMQPIDDEIAALLNASSFQKWGDNAELSGAAGYTALELMLDTGRLYFGDKIIDQEALVRGEHRTLNVEWIKQGTTYRLHTKPGGEAIRLPVNPPCYLDPGDRTIGPLAMPDDMDPDAIELLEQAPPVSAREADRISRLLALRLPALPTPKRVAFEERKTPPQPRLTLTFEPALPTTSTLELDFLYGDTPVSLEETRDIPTIEYGKRLLRIHRDKRLEAEAQTTLLATDAVQTTDKAGRFRFHSESTDRQAILGEWFDFVDTTLSKLEQQGWRIEQTETAPFTLSRAESLDAEVETPENDWFSLRFDLEVDGKKLPLLPLVSDLLTEYRPNSLPETLYLETDSGHFISIPGERIEPVLQTIIDLYDHADSDDEALRLSRLDAPRLLELGETRVRGGNELRRLANKLRGFKGIKPVKLPTTFKGELREYQQQGLNWLQFLREYGLGGILADDMGLGKTVQTLAHLAVEKRAGRMKHPSLIIAPTSLMGNWRREAAQFTPNLDVLVLHGPSRHEHFDTLSKHDLILTTYPLLPRDADILLESRWHYLILDEAQQIKNPKSQSAELVRELPADHRLCLTGTPMENHLGELWAQFDFLLPGFLGNQQQFVRNYRTPIEKQGDREKLKRLSQRAAPFMLRRTKEQVAKELPPKSELVRTTPIEGKQASLYESIRLTMEKRVRDAIAKKGLSRSHITILDALLKLRQVCCDPRLLPKGTRGAGSATSAKMAMLMELLPEMLDEGRRILLFSQFTTMLGLIEKELIRLQIPYAKLTGQTRKRDEAIQRFRSGEVALFLISLKAGGVGLNLTEADTVIHYDPWWNPAVEEQATDRAHRIGQDKPVFVYKLVTEGTVEEKILALQARKRRLTQGVYNTDSEQQGPAFDADSIRELFSTE